MTPQKFCRADEAFQPEPLHYTDCGLDNIFLLNGFEFEAIEGERYLRVNDIDGLHKAIGRHIVLDKKAPTGLEMRFLRTEMGLSQVELAKKIGVSDQSIARWEKGQTDVPGTAVLAFKIIYIVSLLPREKVTDVITKLIEQLDRLAEADDIADNIHLAFHKDGWGDRMAA